ncbi:MAG: helix-turn-helix transcriptional regulator [Xanthomonadales bacterium]|nr:helix-turn-helix transcriptional regulator [Xanthomonadales bacterium]
MKIKNSTPDNQILKELGARLARIRKQRGYSQSKLAEDAGIGVATLRRLEAGHDTQMETWLKLMKSLQMISSIDTLLPEVYQSPMAEVMAAKKRRKKKADTASASAWGDEG